MYDVTIMAKQPGLLGAVGNLSEVVVRYRILKDAVIEVDTIPMKKK